MNQVNPSEITLAVIELILVVAPRIGALSLGPAFVRELDEIEHALKLYEMLKLQSGLSPERVKELRREALRRHTETFRSLSSFSSVIEDNGTYVIHADDGANMLKELSARVEPEPGQEVLKGELGVIDGIKIIKK